MCIPDDVATDLLAAATQLKDDQESRAKWLATAQEGGWNDLPVTRAEGERIFADRLAGDEARLKELGWSRTVRVESNPIPQPQRMNGEPG